jgi:hypothetical protein
MLVRTLLDIVGVVIYTILVVLFFSLEVEVGSTYDSDCSFEAKCYRFCCKDEQSCNEKFVKETFNSSYSGSADFWFMDEDDNTTIELKAFFGEPKCYLKETDPDKPYELMPVRTAVISLKVLAKTSLFFS